MCFHDAFSQLLGNLVGYENAQKVNGRVLFYVVLCVSAIPTVEYTDCMMLQLKFCL